MKKRLFGKHLIFAEAVATLVGTIIGAGVLAIPYAIQKAGFLTGLLDLVILSAVVIFLHLYVGEVVLRTRGNYQLPGYAERYLGKKGKMLMTFMTASIIYGALTAYMIGVGRSLAAIFGMQNSITLFGMTLSADLFFGLLFFAFASTIVYLGLTFIRKSELLMSSIVITIIILICAFIFLKIDISNLASFNISKMFIPYGVILFALAGAVAVPEMKEELVKNKKLLKRAIIIGTLIPIALYALFSLVIVGVCGSLTSEVATIYLGQRFGIVMTIFGNLFATFAMATSFLTLGLGLQEIYNYDYKIKKHKAWALACLIPLVLFLLIFFFIREEIFYKTIGLTGGMAMTIEGILLVIMFNRAKRRGNRKPEYVVKRSTIVSIVLIALFLLGMTYTILNFFGLI